MPTRRLSMSTKFILISQFDRTGVRRTWPLPWLMAWTVCAPQKWTKKWKKKTIKRIQYIFFIKIMRASILFWSNDRIGNSIRNWWAQASWTEESANEQPRQLDIRITNAMTATKNVDVTRKQCESAANFSTWNTTEPIFAARI